ncbi:MAG: hypothetical protein H6851_01515 [Geminicoccaceae bacterium]|nr:hypothetical protein [Geminicoccaceae bacterium]
MMSARFRPRILKRRPSTPRNAAGSTRSGTAGSPATDEELQLLTQIGYSAVIRGLIEESRPIFEALKICAPNNAAAAIGLALGALIQGDLDQAIAILKRDGISKPKSGNEAKAVLMIALQLAGRQNEADILKRDMAQVGGPASQLANMLRG